MLVASEKRTKQYLTAAVIVFAVAFITILLTVISLSGMSVPYSHVSEDEENIILRTADLTGNHDATYRAFYRVGSGYYTAGDYLINGFTSSDYLVSGKDDQAFASDLSTVIYGGIDQDMVDEAMTLLRERSRMYVINEMLGNKSSSLKASSHISTQRGDSFTNCELTSSLEGEGGITIGIRKVEGTFETTGDGIRTDFFVDGVCYPGNIVISDSGEGKRDFVMSWNSDGVSSGEHEVLILLRSSDGRGTVIAGGDIYVPQIMTLVNYNVQPGSIASGSSSSWYVLNAESNNAYVNFLNLSADIKVSIYDAYGNFIGYNDEPGTDCEILRAGRQDVEAISADTGLSGITNTFYIKVERGAQNVNPSDAVSYTMVQSREVAYYNGGYASVVNAGTADISNFPTDGLSPDFYGRQIQIQDINNNIITENYEDLSYVPINGVLDSLKIIYTGSGVDFHYVPEFSPRVRNYGFTAADCSDTFTINASAREGNFATVTIRLYTSSRTEEIPLGGTFHFDPGENELCISVLSFDGIEKDYSIYVLIGDDDGSFSEDTLSLFPESYGSGLWLLHSVHPEYIFTPYETGLGFGTVLDYEDSGSRSLANIYSNPSWVNSSSPEYDGGGWHAANNATVSYFLDPRNYLDESHIFSLENLSFNPDVQSVEGVEAMISGSFMDTDSVDYAHIIYNAGEVSGVSPYLLASRIIQEMGYSGISALCSGTLPGYEGYYNFFNIGSVPDPSVENGALINGARYAMWGSSPDLQTIDESEEALMLPWDNIEDAITGGALWIAQGYIDVGQDTLYFQKFDVISNNDGLYSHQYAQNISMAYSEGQRYYRSYSLSGMIDQPFEFIVPVYSNLPASYGELP